MVKLRIMKNPSISIKSFLETIIDYAGMYPPAKLPFDEAFANYLEYLQDDYGWMISKFVLDSKTIQKLREFVEKNDTGRNKISLTVLLEKENSETDLKKNIEDELREFSDLTASLKEQIQIDSFEFKIPEDMILKNSTKEVSYLLDLVSETVRSAMQKPVFIFYEGKSEKRYIKLLIDALAQHNSKSYNSGLKLRTGSTELNPMPDVADIVFAIRTCLDREIPMKFTAGLHHPLRHFDSPSGKDVHGFFNVFAAGIIAFRHNISDFGLMEIINDKDANDFIFTDEYFSWKDWKISIEEITGARKNLVTAFGSCSFDEPVDDLKKLNLI
jgi:hypothetical protein